MNQRRNRSHPKLLELTEEVQLNYKKLVQPLFVVQGLTEKQAVPGLGGVFRETPDSLVRQVAQDKERGVSKFILFGVPSEKRDEKFDFDFTATQIHHLKKEFGADIWLAVDVCLCSYTSHGHCGVLNNERSHVDNHASVSELTRAALAYAQHGADCVAPSDMMDGRIASIRAALDQDALDQKTIMSYSAKFNSRFYGPFRVAADSAPKEGISTLRDRSSYQILPSRYSDALASSLRDAAEGADILMVKPAMPYLDVLYRLSQEIPTKPWAVYEVSGEYAAVELLGEKGLIDPRLGHLEAWTGMFRAGAQMVLSYGARHAKGWI